MIYFDQLDIEATEEYMIKSDKKVERAPRTVMWSALCLLKAASQPVI